MVVHGRKQYPEAKVEDCFGPFFLAKRQADKGGEFLIVLTRLRMSEQTCKELLMDQRLMTVDFYLSYYPICPSCFFYPLEKEPVFWKSLPKQLQIRKEPTDGCTWPQM